MVLINVYLFFSHESTSVNIQELADRITELEVSLPYLSHVNARMRVTPIIAPSEVTYCFSHIHHCLLSNRDGLGTSL